MPVLAIIRDGRVDNVILADDWPDSVDVTDMNPRPSIGWAYDGQVFTPVERQQEPQPRKITRLAFRQRFTQAEMVALEIAGLDDPTAPMQQRQLAASVRVMQRQVSDATYIDLDRPDTRAGVQQLEAVGILAPGRALEILDAPIQPSEEYA